MAQENPDVINRETKRHNYTLSGNFAKYRPNFKSILPTNFHSEEENL